MFEVLVFVYENYWRGDACPEWQQLGRKLSAHGFEEDEIREALRWLDGLSLATQGISLDRTSDGQTATVRDAAENPPAIAPSSGAMRIYSIAEQEHLGADCLGFLTFLDSAGVLPGGMREIVLERAMAASGEPVSLDEFKIMVLMVYWGAGIEPDALVLDELCDDREGRVAH